MSAQKQEYCPNPITSIQGNLISMKKVKIIVFSFGICAILWKENYNPNKKMPNHLWHIAEALIVTREQILNLMQNKPNAAF